METDGKARKGRYGDEIDQRIISFLAAADKGAELREVLAHLGWRYSDATRERATRRLNRMIERHAVSARYAGTVGQRGRTFKVYTYLRPLHGDEGEAPPPPAEPVKDAGPKPVPLKSLPPHLVEAVEAARVRFDPVEPLEGRAFRLGQFTVSEDELFAILDREPGVLSRVAERFIGGGAGA